MARVEIEIGIVLCLAALSGVGGWEGRMVVVAVPLWTNHQVSQDLQDGATTVIWPVREALQTFT